MEAASGSQLVRTVKLGMDLDVLKFNVLQRLLGTEPSALLYLPKIAQPGHSTMESDV